MSFTCLTCRVLFNTSEIQRSHYKSEWHRYNLKRKVAELPPVTEEQFLTKEARQKSPETKQTPSAYCGVCRKYFATRNAIEAHQRSKKHRTLAEKSVDKPVFDKVKEKSKQDRQDETKHDREETIDVHSEDEDDDDDDDDEWESCDEEETTAIACPFCALNSETVEINLRHMTINHSFFIPDPEYVVDVPGLIAYLNRKTTEDCVCIWCQRTFGSAESVRRHMADLGHAKMLHEGETLLEYEDFYDYTSSYPEGVENSTDVVGAQVWIDDDDWELVLPSGSRVGHRSLARYYRQNLPPRDHRKKESSKKLLRGMTSCYRALGWTGATDRSAVSKAKDLHFANRIRSERALKLGLRNNKLQPHFRPQVVF